MVTLSHLFLLIESFVGNLFRIYFDVFIVFDSLRIIISIRKLIKKALYKMYFLGIFILSKITFSILHNKQTLHLKGSEGSISWCTGTQLCRYCCKTTVNFWSCLHNSCSSPKRLRESFKMMHRYSALRVLPLIAKATISFWSYLHNSCSLVIQLIHRILYTYRTFHFEEYVYSCCSLQVKQPHIKLF